MTDIDQLVTNAVEPETSSTFAEYDHARAVAVIELKREDAGSLQELRTRFHTSANYRVLSNIRVESSGKCMLLPFYQVRYGRNGRWYNVTPINESAKERIEESLWNVQLDLITYVEFLYHLRGRSVPKKVLKALNEYDEKMKEWKLTGEGKIALIRSLKEEYKI